MKQIKIAKWEVDLPDGKNAQESLLTVLSNLLSAKKPEDMPRGLDKFRLFTRIVKAFDEADKVGLLTLEEADYTFLKNMIETDIPSFWGTNVNITNAVEEFMSAK